MFSVDGKQILNYAANTDSGKLIYDLWALAERAFPSENFGDSFTGVIFGALAVVSGFEHISYHIPLSNNLDLAPYISLLRYKYSYEYGNYSNPDFISEQLCFASGIQLNKYFGKFVLSPYAEFDVGYKDHAPGFNIGAYFGIYFKSKRN